MSGRLKLRLVDSETLYYINSNKPSLRTPNGQLSIFQDASKESKPPLQLRSLELDRLSFCAPCIVTLLDKDTYQHEAGHWCCADDSLKGNSNIADRFPQHNVRMEMENVASTPTAKRLLLILFLMRLLWMNY